ncbi:MAG: hypothetical protein WAN87_09910 [Thermoplasmata archaeon]
MNVVATQLPVEHLTPHDLVTYFRCPHEMELLRAHHQSIVSGQVIHARTPLDVIPLHHSPLFSPPLGQLTVYEGPLDVGPHDVLVYQDSAEEEIPILFPSDQIRLDPRFSGRDATLVDPEWGLSGRPDLIVRRGDREIVPIEYKSTHLFVGYHETHGRTFDTLQVIAECRLVQAVFGQRPSHGIVWYGDVASDGQREGWVEIPYGESEERWLKVALSQIRADAVRPPVPAERNCAGCEPNSEGLCRFAAARYEGPHHRSLGMALPRE